MRSPPTTGDAARKVWSAGDFGRIASAQTIVGELLCERVGLRWGERVLDVAAGSGNTTLAAARRGARVTAFDASKVLLREASTRGSAERLPLSLAAGSFEALPFPRGAFDVVLSTFGAMFAEHSERAASELVRVCRPGGRIGLACWTPTSLVGRSFRILDRYAKEVPRLASSTRWGTEAFLRRLFGAQGTIEVRRRSISLRARSASDAAAGFLRFFGPALSALRSAGPAEQERLRREVLLLYERSGAPGEGAFFAPVPYLEAVVTLRRRGRPAAPLPYDA